MYKNLTDRLRKQADNVASSGWLNAERLMIDAAWVIDNMNDPKKYAAKLYHTMHPQGNFYKLSYENQQKYIEGVKALFEEVKR